MSRVLQVGNFVDSNPKTYLAGSLAGTLTGIQSDIQSKVLAALYTMKYLSWNWPIEDCNKKVCVSVI